MRKIKTREEEEKGRKRNQTILGILLILVMIVSSLGYAFTSSDSANKKVKYGDYVFKEVNGYWTVVIGEKEFSFFYNPTETDKLNISLNSIDKFSGKPLYISSEDSMAESEIARNLNGIVSRMQYACLNDKCEGDFPIKTCEDNFILIKESDEDRISQIKNCIFIEGKSESLPKLADEVLFDILGIRNI